MTRAKYGQLKRSLRNLICLLVFTYLPMAHANERISREFRELEKQCFAMDPRTQSGPHLNSGQSCAFCHSEYAGLNAFGRDIAKQLANPFVTVRKAIENIAQLDSDGDGISNGLELENCTLPGSISSPEVRFSNK